MSETDGYYIGRCLDGHPDDFRFLVRRYQVLLLAHLAGKLGNRDKAEEAAQETLVRAYFNMSRLKNPDAFFAWLLGIANYVAKEHIKKEQLQKQREAIRVFSQESPSAELSQDYVLEGAIARLPDVYREVVLLRYYGGQSCSQVAQRLGMPIGTVTKTLSRAYVMLRKSLQGQRQTQTQVDEVLQ